MIFTVPIQKTIMCTVKSNFISIKHQKITVWNQDWIFHTVVFKNRTNIPASRSYARTLTSKMFHISSVFVCLTWNKIRSHKSVNCLCLLIFISRSCYSFIFANFAAWSAAIRLSMISSKSPFITLSILYKVNLIRCSVTRPCGKL